MRLAKASQALPMVEAISRAHGIDLDEARTV